MPGEPDPLYIAAKRVLLDELEALSPPRNAVILVGAQAIYLHTGPSSFLSQSARPMPISPSILPFSRTPLRSSLR